MTPRLRRRTPWTVRGDSGMMQPDFPVVSPPRGAGVAGVPMTNPFSLFSDLKHRIEARDARIATLGLGYVGLPLALSVHDAGFPATGFDINADRVDAINRGERVISYFTPDRISGAVAGGRFSASADMARLAEMDAILICVPTPLSGDHQPDLTAVKKAGETIAAHLRPGQLIVLESTVWPGATAG